MCGKCSSAGSSVGDSSTTDDPTASGSIVEQHEFVDVGVEPVGNTLDLVL